VHVNRNIIAIVPKKFQKNVADYLRSIFFAPSRGKAFEQFNIFKKKWMKDIPSLGIV